MNDAPCLAGILLAAGASSRLGRPKQLVEIHGQSLVRRAAKNWLGLGSYGVELLPLTVVAGHAAGKVEQQLADLPVDVEVCPDWSDGMGASLAFGAGLVPREADGVMVMLCDQWRLDSSGLFCLVESWFSDISAICASQWGLKNALLYGPPCIYPCNFIHELKCIQKDRGARSLIDRHRDSTRFVQLDEAEFDLDTAEDLAYATGAENQA